MSAVVSWHGDMSMSYEVGHAHGFLLNVYAYLKQIHITLVCLYCTRISSGKDM